MSMSILIIYFNMYFENILILQLITVGIGKY